jgi:hypothetical protein
MNVRFVLMQNQTFKIEWFCFTFSTEFDSLISDWKLQIRTCENGFHHGVHDRFVLFVYIPGDSVMNIALYRSHHQLPFWRSSWTNPYMMINPHALDAQGWWWQQDGDVKSPASTYFLMPVLQGLYNLHVEGVFAHVSLNLDQETFRIQGAHRVWVQLTTIPKKWVGGLPVVFNEETKPTVLHLWGGDNSTSTPFDWVRDEQQQIDPKSYNADFWSEFFLGKLQATKQHAQQRFDAAKNYLEVCRGIPDAS